MHLYQTGTLSKESGAFFIGNMKVILMNGIFLYPWQAKKHTFHFPLGKEVRLLSMEVPLDISVW